MHLSARIRCLEVDEPLQTHDRQGNFPATPPVIGTNDPVIVISVTRHGYVGLA